MNDDRISLPLFDQMSDFFLLRDILVNWTFRYILRGEWGTIPVSESILIPEISNFDDFSINIASKLFTSIVFINFHCFNQLIVSHLKSILVKQVIFSIIKLEFISILSVLIGFHFVVYECSLIKVAIFPFSCSIQNDFIVFSLINIFLCVPDPFSFAKIKSELSFINFMCVDLSTVKMFCSLVKLANVMYSICLEDTISVKQSTGVALTNVNYPSSIFCLVDEDVFFFVSHWWDHFCRFLRIRVLR